MNAARAIGLLCVIAGVVPSSAAAAQDTPPVTFLAAEAAAGIGDATWIDAGACDGAGRHVPGAACVRWQQTAVADSGVLADPATLATLATDAGVAPDRAVVVYGDWDEGWGEEGRIAWVLAQLGHERVAVVLGGADAVAVLPTPPTSVHAPAPLPGSARLTLRTTLADLESVAPPHAIDVRTLPEFAGATLFGEARGGHIPDASHVSLDALLTPTGLVDRRDGLARLEAAGVPLDAPVAAYCTGGVRSALAALILRWWGLDARNYDGSWWEYAASDAPVAIGVW